MNWSTLNILWTAIAAVGVFFSAKVWIECFHDWRFAQKQGAERPQRLVAQIALIAESAVLFIQVFFLGLGFVALANPLRFAPELREAVNDIIVTCFIIGAVLLMLSSIGRNVYRKLILDNLDEGEEREARSGHTGP